MSRNATSRNQTHLKFARWPAKRLLWARHHCVLRNLRAFFIERSGAGDAIHLVTVLEMGLPELWTNDRHLGAAAGYAWDHRSLRSDGAISTRPTHMRRSSLATGPAGREDS
jgi:hypothetical protein